MSRWWRAYDEAVDDPKLILLTDQQHRAWFNLCCIASQGGGALPAVAVIAVKLRVKPDKAKHVVAELAALGLVDHVEGGKFEMHNWSGRQFKSDVSTDRVKRFRNGERNVSSAVSETVSETETERPQSQKEQKTDTETERVLSLRSENAAEKKSRKKPASRMPDDWKPQKMDCGYGLSGAEIHREFERFKNNARQNDRSCSNWDAAWRNWCLKAVEFLGRQPNVPGEASEKPKFVRPRHGQLLGPEFGEKAAGRYFVLAETAEWDAWCSHIRGLGKPAPPRHFFEGWAFSTLWPPGCEPQSEAAE